MSHTRESLARALATELIECGRKNPTNSCTAMGKSVDLIDFATAEVLKVFDRALRP